jgi:hypothetical protein
MYGDTTVIRALAGRLRDQGSEIRAEAALLQGAAESVPWSGLAADAMRRLAHDHGGRLRSCAALHDEAADALERHAREVDRLEDLIAAVERRVLRLLDDVGGALHALASHVVPDGVDAWLAGFQAPPHGSKAWLHVRVPGSL